MMSRTKTILVSEIMAEMTNKFIIDYRRRDPLLNYLHFMVHAKMVHLVLREVKESFSSRQAQKVKREGTDETHERGK